MESQFNNPEFSDIVIDLVDVDAKEQKSLSLHKVILASYSDFYRRLFQPGFREANQSRVRVEVSDIKEAEGLLHWMYTKDRFIPDEMQALAEMWLMLKPATEAIPYPGIRGEFIHEEGDWDKLIHTGASLNRMIMYKSITGGSTIKELEILGYSDGDIRVQIEYPTELTDELDIYLKEYHIDIKPSLGCGFYISPWNNVKQATMLIEIVTKHNHFESEDLEVINRIMGITVK